MKLISALGEGAISPDSTQCHSVPLLWTSQLVNDRARPKAGMWQSVLILVVQATL